MIEWTKLEALIVNRRQELNEIAERSRLVATVDQGNRPARSHEGHVPALPRWLSTVFAFFSSPRGAC